MCVTYSVWVWAGDVGWSLFLLLFVHFVNVALLLLLLCCYVLSTTTPPPPRPLTLAACVHGAWHMTRVPVFTSWCPDRALASVLVLPRRAVPRPLRLMQSSTNKL